MKRPATNILFSAVCLLLAASTVARSELFVSSAHVSFQLSSEEKSYAVDETVRLNYVIKNITRLRCMFPWNGKRLAQPFHISGFGL